MVTPNLPDPLVPAEVDLRGYDFMPFFGDALDRSDFNKTPNDTAWRFGVMLWWEAWAKQVPAASLPDDDASLTRACGLGRDIETFRKIRAEALHGFVLCNDGRLYHKFLAGHAIEAYEGRVKQRVKTAAARIASLKKRVTESVTDAEKTYLTGLIQELEQTLSQAAKKKPSKSDTGRATHPVTDPPTDKKDGLSAPQSQTPQGEGQGQGEGKREGQGKGELPPPPPASVPFADLPEQPSEIAHYANWLTRRGMDATAVHRPTGRTVLGEWAAAGVGWDDLEAVWAEADRSLGSPPGTPTYLNTILKRLRTAGKLRNGMSQEDIATLEQEIFGEGASA